MSDGFAKARWSHTSAIMALVANVNRDPKKGRAFQPSDFDPTSEKREKGLVIRIDEDNKENIGLLREAFEGMTQQERSQRK